MCELRYARLGPRRPEMRLLLSRNGYVRCILYTRRDRGAARASNSAGLMVEGSTVASRWAAVCAVARVDVVVTVVGLRRRVRATAADAVSLAWTTSLSRPQCGGRCSARQHGIVIVIVIVFDIRSTSVLRYSAPLREGGPRFLPGCSFCDIRFGVPGLRYVVWRNYATSVAWPTDGFTDPWLSRWSCL